MTKRQNFFKYVFPILCTMGSLNAFAVGSAGCGLGSVVFQENKWWKQSLAATTNATLLNQSFAITSGTSNCAPGAWAYEQQQHDYMIANFTVLQKETAQGGGETVNGLATVLGCPASTYESFSAYTQSQYTDIFNTESPDTALYNIKNILTHDQILSQQCSLAFI